MLFGPPKVEAPIVFYVRLDANDWEAAVGAWRCSALRIPAAHVGEIRNAGQLVAPEQYRVDLQTSMIFWIGQGQPVSMAVRIEVSKTLITATDASQLGVRVAQFGALATITGAVITGYAGYATALAKNNQAPPANSSSTSATVVATNNTANIDPAKADSAAVFQQACDKGNMAGCNHLGVAYSKGTGGVALDDQAASKLFRRSCEGGYMEGCANLGSQYERGIPILDRTQAVSFYRRACEGGYANGCFSLGLAQSEGIGGLTKSEPDAVLLYRKACDMGSALGCNNLAVAYLNGRGGLAKNEAKAVELYRRACDSDNMVACDNLGAAYYQGQGGLQKDREMAVKLFRRACDGGYPNGCSNLALATSPQSGPH